MVFVLTHESVHIIEIHHLDMVGIASQKTPSNY